MIIYPTRSMEQLDTHPYRSLLNSDLVHRVYLLDELGEIERLPLVVALMALTTMDEASTPEVARSAARAIAAGGISSGESRHNRDADNNTGL